MRPIADTSYPRQGKPTAVRERVFLSRQEAPSGAGSRENCEHESATFIFFNSREKTDEKSIV